MVLRVWRERTMGLFWFGGEVCGRGSAGGSVAGGGGDCSCFCDVGRSCCSRFLELALEPVSEIEIELVGGEMKLTSAGLSVEDMLELMFFPDWRVDGGGYSEDKMR